MANALKCDRCGSYFDYSPATKNFIAFGHKDIIVEKNFPVKDICPDCMVMFMTWFENPGNVRNLTDEETDIYESWIDSEAKDTGVNTINNEEGK